MHRWRLLFIVAVTAPAITPLHAEPLPDTKPLMHEGDLAAQMVEGIDKYLMRELAASVKKRKEHWKPDFSSAEAYTKSVQPNRERLKKILGVVDKRVPFTGFESVGTIDQPALVAETDSYKVFAVRWPVLPGVDGEGLLLEPKGKVLTQVIVLPDADTTPEVLAGMKGITASPIAQGLAESGCRVLVPVLIDRADTWSGNPKLGRLTNQPHREFVYRMTFEMGRHLIGYEVQKVLAAVDGFCREKDHPLVGVLGKGEGGSIALYSDALDERIAATVVSGYFGPRAGVWQEPIYRNVFGLLREFGDAEVAHLILPRTLIVEASQLGGNVSGPPAPRPGRGGAAPGRLTSDRADKARPEVERAALRLGDVTIRPPLFETFLFGEGKTLNLLLVECPKEKVECFAFSEKKCLEQGRTNRDIAQTEGGALDFRASLVGTVRGQAAGGRAATAWPRCR